jgi:hypothetical protein
VTPTDFQIESSSEPLDLFSTSPTVGLVLSPVLRCENHAPFFAFQRGGGRYGVVQGCCNSWSCARCGVLVAKQHYGRIVEGAREISKEHQLYFITVTCRGLELSAEEATNNYGKWTNRLLGTMREKQRRAGNFWTYVQVTEKQKRGHPHSHVLTTFAPHDLVDGAKAEYATSPNNGLVFQWVDCLRSDWLQEMVQSAGLGEQYDVSVVKDFEAASRYVAKYMFKPSQFTDDYPKGWKRVRYSQSWPKLPEIKTNAFVLLSAEDWKHLARLAVVVDAPLGDALESAEYFLRGSDTVVTVLKSVKNSLDAAAD